MIEDEVIARADANFHYVWSIAATGHDGGEVRHHDGLLLTNTALEVAMFNQAIVTRPLTDPEAQLRDAAAYFDAAGMPFVVRVRDGLDAAAERACEALGMPYSDTVPGMALRDMRVPAPHEGIQIRTASSEREFDDFLLVASTVFDFPIELFKTVFSQRVLAMPDVECYVGYSGGKAIATSSLLISGRTAGIANVATDAAHRGRGIGEAMTWHCVRRGAEMGCVMAALQASEMGQPVYERMGFRVVSPWRTFHR